MKKFKFRAWDKVHKEMINWEQYKDELVSSDFTDEDLVLMQYTGLKDKDGVEIYEGDILEHTSSLGRQIRVMNLLVSWSEVDAAFLFGSIRTDHAIRSSRVIGNIFENPELRKED